MFLDGIMFQLEEGGKNSRKRTIKFLKTIEIKKLNKRELYKNMKKNKMLIACLSSVAILALGACQPTSSSTDSNDSSNSNSSQVDTKVASIEIVKGSIETTYSVGDKVSYANLAINTLDASKKVIETLKAADNATTITYTNIDTSEVTAGKTFTVTYKKDGEEPLSADLTYTVKEKEIEYQLTNWMPNKSYTDTKETVINTKISTSEESPESGFMDKGEYNVGNDNSVNLLPIMTAINPDNPLDTKTIDTIPSSVTFQLLDSTDIPVTIEDYLENVSEFKSKGIVKFKDSVTGHFTIIMTSPDQENPIKYVLNVVDGYNVTSAKDCFALDTASGDFYSADAEKMRAWKEKEGVPYANGLVFQKDVTINKSDLPEFYLWGDDATSDKVKGTYKDWQGLFDYRFDEEKTVTIYGNNHRLMLNDAEGDSDAFPLIVTDSMNGETQEANKPISTHASIFYTHEGDGVDPSKCVFSVQNLEFSGNNGVSAESTITTGGPMFLKAKTSAELKYVNISKTYMAAMLDNWTSEGFNYFVLDIEGCRFRDLANCAVYIYKNGTANIAKSDLMTAGGPLLFLNPYVEKLPAYEGDTNAYLEEVGKLVYTNINVDGSSFLSNFTEGKGGWFAAYEGAEAYASTIKSVGALTNAQLQMDFLKTDKATNVSKFDFTAFVLPVSSGEGLGLDTNSGGMNVSININDELVYSTLNGASEVVNAYQNYVDSFGSGNQDVINAAALSYVESLSNTDFGNGLTFAGQKQATTFKKFNKDGVAHYGLVNSDGTNYWIENTQYTILKSMGYSDEILSGLGIEKLVGDAFKQEGYISASINSVTMPGSPLDFAKFEGVCNYGLVLGNYHKVN